MNEPGERVEDLELREIAMSEIGEGRLLRDQFLALHAAWIERGLERWLALLSVHASRPVIVIGAFEKAPGAAKADVLLGAVVGAWHHERCDRFDDLLERDVGAA